MVRSRVLAVEHKALHEELQAAKDSGDADQVAAARAAREERMRLLLNRALLVRQDHASGQMTPRMKRFHGWPHYHLSRPEKWPYGRPAP